MQETAKIQNIPLKVYRSSDRLMLAAPMPGLQPEDIVVQVTENGHLTVRGELRGLLKDIKELLVDEWSIGGYLREYDLPDAVDAERANLSYGNGVLVITFPLATTTIPATLSMEHVGVDRGERVGNSGHPFKR
jgi:HSP20 family protein